MPRIPSLMERFMAFSRASGFCRDWADSRRPREALSRHGRVTLTYELRWPPAGDATIPGRRRTAMTQNGALSKNMRLLGHNDLGGFGNCGEGMAIQMARDGRRVIWLGHESAPKNFTAVDVTDPRKPSVIVQTDLPHGDMRSNNLDLVATRYACRRSGAAPGPPSEIRRRLSRSQHQRLSTPAGSGVDRLHRRRRDRPRHLGHGASAHAEPVGLSPAVPGVHPHLAAA